MKQGKISENRKQNLVSGNHMIPFLTPDQHKHERVLKINSNRPASFPLILLKLLTAPDVVKGKKSLIFAS